MLRTLSRNICSIVKRKRQNERDLLIKNAKIVKGKEILMERQGSCQKLRELGYYFWEIASEIGSVN